MEAGEEFVSASGVGEIARAAEQAGFAACYVTDHPFPDDRWLAAGGHHALDPFVALSFAASATTTLRVQTHALVLPYRNPLLVAHAAASLDALSGGRLILGVAAGYLAGEFRALGMDPERRNERLDQGIETLRRAWSGGFAGNTLRPRPAQQPGPPIWVGGNSRRAIRRAVEHGEGWLPFPNPAPLARHLRTAALESMDQLRERIAYARAHARAIGRAHPLEICFTPFELAMTERKTAAPSLLRERIGELRELGVTWLTVSLGGETRSAYAKEVEAFGRDVIAGLA